MDKINPMEKHINIVGILHIILSILGIVTAFIIFVIVTGAGMASGDETAMMITSIVGPGVAFVIAVFSLPGIVAGIWIMQHKEWARVLMIVISILGLLNIPFGTVLGIYSLWVLFNNDTISLFKKAI